MEVVVGEDDTATSVDSSACDPTWTSWEFNVPLSDGDGDDSGVEQENQEGNGSEEEEDRVSRRDHSHCIKKERARTVIIMGPDGCPMEVHPCTICGKKFKTAAFLRKHSQNHPHNTHALLSSKRLFQCTQCSYVTSRRSHFHSHALHHHHQSSSVKLGSRHPTPSPHSCPLCPYQTAEAGLLSQHLSTVHSQSLPHLCQHCGKGFRHPSELRKHVRSHSGERPYACDLCTYRSAQAYNLQMHIRARHRHQPNFRCTVCGVAFSCLSELRRHVVLHGAEREYHCPHCTHRSSNSFDLKRHIVSIHTRNFPHRCQVCDKGFHRPSELTKHMGTHRGRRSHNCRHCDFHSTDPFALSRHVLSSHTHELPHQCRRCKKSFKLQTELKKHMKYHSGKKVYQCEFCDYHTMDASGYKRHVISMHTKDYPHRCPVCDKGFRRPSEQRQHLLRTHSLSSFP
uniref:zinc finger Y-chromosomal protein 1-like n=1 Tax=Myxine glutinosa TaxID=7769 RepID=UPI00358DE9D7